MRYNEKLERNQEIYQDRLSGLSWYQLSLKYGLNVKTVYVICKRMQKREEKANG